MKRWMATIVMGLLTACQTLPDQPAFADRQIRFLEEAGFERVGENFELGLEDRLLFDIDRSEVRPEMVARLGELARSMATFGILGTRIEGHADATGGSGHNIRLSQGRAEAVKSVLVANGLQSERIESLGRGEGDPVATNETAEGRAQNRRVVLLVRPADLEPY